MDAGRVAQFGTPAELLRDTHGAYYAMASHAGIIGQHGSASASKASHAGIIGQHGSASASKASHAGMVGATRQDGDATGGTLLGFSEHMHGVGFALAARGKSAQTDV